MDGLDLKQMTSMIDIIAEEKGLSKDIILGVIEDAIAAAWLRPAQVLMSRRQRMPVKSGMRCTGNECGRRMATSAATPDYGFWE